MALGGQQSLGPYRLLNIVKTGQTSQVWAVINDLNQDRMALKILLSEFRKDREHLAYLRHEFTVGKGMDHKRVMHITDHMVVGGIPFLAMEFFPYPNMKDVINQVRDHVGHLMPRMIEQAAEGLAYFNSQGWIHRDVKPDNFLVTDNGDIKLIDFALAQKQSSAISRLFAPKTKVQGTRSYMSPEQIRGRPLTPASDVYSFACTIYHLVGGVLPFTGTTSNELLNKHLKTPAPSIEAANRNTTPEFSELIRLSMSKRPENRPKSLADFLKEFKAIKVFKRPPQPPAAAVDKESAA